MTINVHARLIKDKNSIFLIVVKGIFYRNRKTYTEFNGVIILLNICGQYERKKIWYWTV